MNSKYENIIVVAIIYLINTLFNIITDFLTVNYSLSNSINRHCYYASFLIKSKKSIIIPENISYIYAFNEDGTYGTVDKPGNIFRRYSNKPLKYDISKSFREDKYFVLPNIKGLSNRLQLFSGIYIISSIYQIPIISIDIIFVNN